MIGCLCNRGIKAGRTWRAPFEFARGLGGFDIHKLAAKSFAEIEHAMAQPTPLHRYVDKVPRALHEAIELIAVEYQGEASRMRADRPSSAEVVMRFLVFHGAGPKIATMAAYILVRHFGIEMADRASIDMSVEVHAKRVFKRCGLPREDGKDHEFIYAARAIHPEYPGIVDCATWETGRSYRRDSAPRCAACPLAPTCEWGARLHRTADR